MTHVKAYAATAAGGRLEPFEYELGALGADEVDIDVRYCGICHSDLSMLDNEWGISEYPLVPGHEVVGTIAAVGSNVGYLRQGQTVGLGWNASSCMHCHECMSGDHNMCAEVVGTIVGRHGGFANKVRADAAWAVPLPDGVDPAKAGPMFCGGVTVFNPILQNHIKAADRVGVVGIGGLGHMALAFLHAWGCEVTAFSTSPAKEDEARALGADHFVSSRDPAALEAVANTFDMILVTVNAELDWEAYIKALRPRGKLHVVGVVPAITVAAFPLIGGQKSIGGSPLGSPATTAGMLGFAGRHAIAPITEMFPMSRLNDAMDRLRSGEARYRIVLENDIG